MLRAQPVRPGPHRGRSTSRRPWRCRACARCSSRADLNPRVHEQWHTAIGQRRARRRPDRRSPRTRSASWATRSRWSWPRTATSPRTRAELVVVDFDPLPAVVDYTRRRPPSRSGSCTRLARQRRSATWPALPPERRRGGLRRGRPRGRPRPSTSRPTPRCRWRPGASSSSWPRSTGELTIWAATQVPHEVRLFCSRLLGLPENRIRVIMRDTGGGFGQKAFVQREEMCVMLAAAQAAGPAQVDRGPAREPDGRRQVPTRARRRRRWRSTTTGIAPGRRASTTCRTPAPIPRRGRSCRRWSVGMLFPGPVPRARWPPSRCKVVLHEHRRAAPPYRGPWQFESVAREVLLDIAARRMAIDPVELRRREPAAARRDAVHQPDRHAPTTDATPAGDLRAGRSSCSTTTAFRAQQAEAAGRGPLPRRRDLSPTSSPPPPASASTRTEGGDDPHRALRAGERVRGRRLERATASRRPSCSSTADALGVDIDDVAHHPGRHRGDAVRRRDVREPQRVDDRRGGRPRRPACSASGSLAIAAHRLEASRRRHRAGRRAGSGARARPSTRHVLRRDRRRSPTSSPASLPPGMPAGPRGERPVHHAAAGPSGPTRPTCAPARSTSRPARSSCCATSSARTAGR